MEHAPRVYQEYRGVAGEITLVCGDPGMEAMGSRRTRSQYTEGEGEGTLSERVT
jgi:hypothetical protein